MKIGDAVRFVGSWRIPDMPSVGIVMETWANGRTKKMTSADVFWENGTHGNVLVQSLEVISESR